MDTTVRTDVCECGDPQEKHAHKDGHYGPCLRCSCMAFTVPTVSPPPEIEDGAFERLQADLAKRVAS